MAVNRPLVICAGMMADRHQGLLATLGEHFEIILHAGSGAFDPNIKQFRPVAMNAEQAPNKLAELKTRFYTALSRPAAHQGLSFDPVEQEQRALALLSLHLQAQEIKAGLKVLAASRSIHAILCGNDFLAPIRAMVQSAKELKIPTVFLNHGTMNYIAIKLDAYRIYTPTLRPSVCDHILIESEYSGDKEAAARYGTGQVQVHNIGIPIAEPKDDNDIKSTRTGPIHLMYCAGWAEANTGTTALFFEYYEILAFRHLCHLAITLGARGHSVQVKIKLHPTQIEICGVNLFDSFKSIAAEMGVDLQLARGEFSTLVKELDLVVNSYCSSTNEIAFYQGIPSITLLSPLLESFLKPEYHRNPTLLSDWKVQLFLQLTEDWEPFALDLIGKRRAGYFQALAQEKTRLENRLPQVNIWNNIVQVLNNISTLQTKGKGASRKRLKILEIVHDFPPNSFAGTELYTLNLSKSLIKMGCDVTVLHPVFRNNSSDPVFKNSSYKGIPVIQFCPPTPPKNDYMNQDYDNYFQELLASNKFDVVHFQHLLNLSANWISIAKNSGVIVLMKIDDMFLYCQTYHLVTTDVKYCSGPETVKKCAECLSKQFQNPDPSTISRTEAYISQRKNILQKQFSQVDYIHSASNFTKIGCEEYGLTNPEFHVVHTGIHPFVALPKVQEPTGKIRIGYMGSIALRKGILDFVEAVSIFEKAIERIPGKVIIQFSVYGNHASDSLYHHFTNKIGTLNSIKYMGGFEPEGRPQIFSNLDLLVVPSIGENYPFIIREALYAGIPVVSTTIAGIPEILTHGKNGYLYPAGSISELAKIFVSIAMDPNTLMKLMPHYSPIKLIQEEAEEIFDIMLRLLKNSKKQQTHILGDSVVDVEKYQITDKSDFYSSDHSGSKPATSIIIPVHNQAALTNLCLEYLNRYSEGILECIVVDNGSTDETPILANKHKWIKYVRNENNLGFAKACNQGARTSTGKFLVFLNNDTVPKKRWLTELIKPFTLDNSIGITGSQLSYPDGKIQHAGVVFAVSLLPYHLFEGLNNWESAVNESQEFQAVTGACLAIRANLFKDLGGFDESYVNGLEDIDLCLKVRQKNMKVVYVPKSRLLHFASRSIGRQENMLNNRDLFLSKWLKYLYQDDFIFLKKYGFTIRLKSKTGRIEFLPLSEQKKITEEKLGKYNSYMQKKELKNALNLLRAINLEFPYHEETLEKFIALSGKFGLEKAATSAKINLNTLRQNHST